jgi:DNA-binding NarL/FixJ family response regulator
MTTQIPVHARVSYGRPLTPREGQVLRLISQGLRNREIAIHLTLSEGTVKAYLTKLLQKIGAQDRIELALIGLEGISVENVPRDAYTIV